MFEIILRIPFHLSLHNYTLLPLNLLLESKLKDKLNDCGGKNMNHEKTKSGSTEI